MSTNKLGTLARSMRQSVVLAGACAGGPAPGADQGAGCGANLLTCIGRSLPMQSVWQTDAMQESALRPSIAGCLCSRCAINPCGLAVGPDGVSVEHRMLMQVMDAEGKLGSKRCKRFSAVIVDNTFKARHALAAPPHECLPFKPVQPLVGVDFAPQLRLLSLLKACPSIGGYLWCMRLKVVL